MAVESWREGFDKYIKFVNVLNKHKGFGSLIDNYCSINNINLYYNNEGKICKSIDTNLVMFDELLKDVILELGKLTKLLKNTEESFKTINDFHSELCTFFCNLVTEGICNQCARYSGTSVEFEEYLNRDLTTLTCKHCGNVVNDYLGVPRLYL